MTDRELADAAWREITLTTSTYPNYVKLGKPASSHFSKAKAYLDQIGPTPPPPPPPPSGRPASFYTGPLGANNLVPSKPGAFLIDYPGGPGTTLASWKAFIAKRETDIGRKFDGIQTQLWWGAAGGGLDPAELAEQRLEWINARGQIVCVSHSANFTIAQTNQGLADAAWTKTATYFKSLGFPVMLRLWWEFNNPAGFPWCVGNTSDIGANFIAAWKRVVGIFKSVGANNVGFWWCPLEGADRDGQETSYPGDAYVDWVGSDTYNGCYQGENCWNGYTGPGWASFEGIALYQGKPHKNCHDLWAARKPFVYGEVGTTLDPAHPELKAQWFPELVAALKTTGKQACGISFFDQDVSSLEGARANWLVDNGAGALAGFKQMTQDPWLNAR